ncbi:Peptide chain release factor 1, mitochondrial [Coemansia asiatica]|uniref:Peptide chain release factor 1, mitochondrial n=1 Tax=Coemansia asiatica TaxID=1052880 RepID=A0A9W8CMP3_9FUNG|nr:Peptide chain release factor 1, mitochondrial [Coemansia asiatica]KAJ2881148.1 Peptide chain release factor 1, mitochondrial [Coemansia asiatica]
MSYSLFRRLLQRQRPVICPISGSFGQRFSLHSTPRIYKAAAAAASPFAKDALPAGSLIAGKSSLTPRIHDKLCVLKTKYDGLNERMSGNISDLGRDELAKLSKDLSDTGLIVVPYKRLLELYEELVELQQMIDSGDPSFRDMALEEKQETLDSIAACEREIISGLLPKDSAEKAGAILEIRAGTGGDEASLFSGDLLRMYERFALTKGWKYRPISLDAEGDMVKEAVVEVSGRGVFGVLMFESGVHRVQRVPATESQGRIHTSTVTVAVLPQATDVHIEIKDSDLRIDVFRASGKGGQHVNTTDSAVRITHIPTGIAVENQQERSQIRNKEKAMQILRARLYDRERQKAESQRRESRNKLIGTGDRSEKCRTYNYAQNRVTDHRINFSLYDLEGVMNGSSLQYIVDQLRIQNDLDELARME